MSPRRFSGVMDLIVVGSLVVSLFLLLPILAIVGLSLQFGFLIAIPLLGLAVLAVPALRRELSREELHRIRGVAVSWGVTVHPKHSWLRLLGWRTARVGVDDLAQRFIGPVESVELPQPGHRFEEGDVLATLSRGERTIPLVAPAPGVVTRVNASLRDRPAALNEGPYSEGWIVEVKLRRAPSTAKLIGVSDIVPWLNAEIERLVALTGGHTPAGATMADGGELSSNIGDELDSTTWQRARNELFAAE
jgi:glycine cleavage system H protein